MAGKARGRGGGVAAVALAAGLAGLAVPAGGQDASLRLSLPIACTLGKDCFTQNYFDHDPTAGAKDHRCGSMTYDGHDGIDIRLPTTAAQRKGVAVLASAGGVVRGVRDGEPDRAITDEGGRAAVKDRECGNGVAVTHPGGWETQYCHMAQGSVVVKSGQAVKAGQKLGNVGLSGWTQFPHVHITVRRAGTAVDPFTGGNAACGQAGRPLWSPTVAAALAYRSPQVINAGFAGSPVEMAGVEQASLPAATRTSPVLSAYVRVIGVEPGDVVSLALIGPDGRDLARSTTPPFDRSKAQQLNFVGARRKGATWPAGRYQLRYEVRRAGKPALSRSATLTL